MRQETALTLDEVVTACQQYAIEQAQDGPYPESDETYVAWCLIKLVGLGLARVVVSELSPLNTSPMLTTNQGRAMGSMQR